MNYYQILGIKQTATQAEIKNAYKALVKKYHPDVYHGDKSFAEKKTKEINEAYKVLSVPETKAEYDEFLNPTPTYNYTPPKYDNPETYTTSYSTYEKYKNSNYTNYNNSYNDFYSKYYSSKNYSNSYNNNNNNNYYDKYNKVPNNISSSNKVKIVFLLILAYLFLMLMTFSQVSSLLSGTKSGAILDVTENYSPQVQNEIYENNKYNFQPENNYEYDFEKIITEEELYTIYLNAFTGTFRSFEDFKNFFEENYHYIEEYYAPKRNQNTITNSTTNSLTENEFTNTTISDNEENNIVETNTISSENTNTFDLENSNTSNIDIWDDNYFDDYYYTDFYYQGLPQTNY